MDSRAQKIKDLIMEAAAKVSDEPVPQDKLDEIEPAVTVIADYGVRVFDILMGR